jgi:16S rRNA (guanine527-N7)-methyltransferase
MNRKSQTDILSNSYIGSSAEQIAAALAPFKVPLSPEMVVQIQAYLHLLAKWNQKVSLTSIKDLETVIRRHFGESFFAARVVPIRHGRLADLGSGAGFPAIPIKMLAPDVHLTLIEPSLKKIAFLQEVVRALNLGSVNIMRGRFQDLSIPERSFDFVTCRALGKFEKVLEWASRALAVDGRVALWLGGRDAHRLIRLQSWTWQAPVRIPESRDSVLLTGTPRTIPR